MTKFKNPYIEEKPITFLNFLKWQFTRRVSKTKSTPPFEKTDLHSINTPKKFQLTWIGHSTLLIQMNGINILTDPIFSKRASPFSFIGPSRSVEPSIKIEDLPKIDYILISHNHYDHLDIASVKRLGNQPLWLVPSGLKKWFKQKGITHVKELKWWESYDRDSLKFYATPSQHWSKRGLFDSFNSLWCSWAIQSKDHNFWFGGDTGYNPIQFKEIGNRLGPFEAAAIPIGCYEPRWFMKKFHVNPEDACKIHQDIQSKLSIGIHWGTFRLADEPLTEPPLALNRAKKFLHIPENEFITLPIGGIQIFEQSHAQSRFFRGR